MKHTRSTKLLSILLALVMVIGLLPVTALAADETVVTVDITVQMAGQYQLIARQVPVSAGLAEEYGYTDQVKGVSVLDVLVKAHELWPTDDWTEENAKEWLTISESGFVTRMFGLPATASGFLLNGGYATDGTKAGSGNSYTGTTVLNTPVTGGDAVDFFFYQDDELYSDYIGWFCQAGAYVDSLSVHGGVELSLTVQGTMYAWGGYLYKDAAAMHAAGGKGMKDAQLAWVDPDTMDLKNIQGAVCDEDGAVTVTAPEEDGTYYLTAYMPEEAIEDDAYPLILQMLPITVDNSLPLPEKKCELSALSVATAESNPNAAALKPEFRSDVTEYTAVSGYPSYAFFKAFYVKAGAANGLVITARLNGGAEIPITSGDTYWKSVGDLNIGDNTVEVKVAESAAEDAASKVYTIHVHMNDDPAGLTASLTSQDLTVGVENSITAVNSQGKKILCDWIVSDTSALTILDGSDKASDTLRFVPAKAASGVVVTATAAESKTSAQCNLPDIAEPPADPEEVLHNIAAKFSQSGIASDGNAPWLAADLAAYAKAFPQTENRLSQAQVRAYLDKLIDSASEAATPAGLAKSIIALRALGYDARQLTTAQLEEVDVVKKLTDLVDSQAASVTNQYTLPYVLIALQQGRDYATQAQLNWLIQTALDTQSNWQKTSSGTDGTAPMILALAPYYDSNEQVKEAVDAALEAVKAYQKEDGSMGNAASTGLAMAAFAALGREEPVNSSGKSLTDGLMTQVTDSLDGFKPDTNSFSTEQGMRGLVAKALNGRVYDFLDAPMEPAQATWAEHCPVEIRTIPEDAAVEVRLSDTVQTPKAGKLYDLAAGTYDYTASKSGYLTASGSFTISEQEAAGHTARTVSISLSSDPGDTGRKISVSVQVLTHDSSACGGKYTYKDNKSAYTTVIAQGTAVLKAGQSAFDALDQILKRADVSYREKSYGYIDRIGDEEEFGHGSANSGWQFLVNGQLPTVSCRDYVFTGDAQLIWYFTDDYTAEKGAEQWAPTPGGSTTPKTDAEVETTPKADGTIDVTVKVDGKETEKVAGGVKVEIPDVGDGQVLVIIDADGKETIVKKSLVEDGTAFAILDGSCTIAIRDNSKDFTDVADESWYADAVQFAASHGLFSGVSDAEFAPDSSMTRSMLATVLWRLEDEVKAAGGSDFADIADGKWYSEGVAWASSNGIVSGYGDGKFGPEDSITREQLATMLYRYAKAIGMDTSVTKRLRSFHDGGRVSDWASEAMGWAVGNGIIGGKGNGVLDPAGNATRAEVAIMLQRLVKLMVK